MRFHQDQEYRLVGILSHFIIENLTSLNKLSLDEIMNQFSWMHLVRYQGNLKAHDFGYLNALGDIGLFVKFYFPYEYDGTAIQK